MTSRSEVVRELEADGGKGAFEIVDAGKRLFRHPDNAETAVVGHAVAGPIA